MPEAENEAPKFIVASVIRSQDEYMILKRNINGVYIPYADNIQTRGDAQKMVDFLNE